MGPDLRPGDLEPEGPDPLPDRRRNRGVLQGVGEFDPDPGHRTLDPGDEVRHPRHGGETRLQGSGEAVRAIRVRAPGHANSHPEVGLLAPPFSPRFFPLHEALEEEAGSPERHRGHAHRDPRATKRSANQLHAEPEIRRTGDPGAPLEDPARERGGEGERSDDRRHQHGARRERQGQVVDAELALEIDEGNEDDERRRRGGQDRERRFPGAPLRGHRRPSPGPPLPVNALDHHDRSVHGETEADRQPRQGLDVQAQARDADQAQGCEDGEGDGGEDDRGDPDRTQKEWQNHEEGPGGTQSTVP